MFDIITIIRIETTTDNESVRIRMKRSIKKR